MSRVARAVLPAVVGVVLAAAAVLAGSVVAPAPAGPTADAPPSEAPVQAAVERRTAEPAPTAEPVFSTPGDGAVRARITRLLRRTPPGGTVRAVTWTYDDPHWTRELLRAHRRGVTVRLLVGGIACGEPELRRLRARLDRPSYARCVRAAARGASRFGGAPTNLHQKSWTFTRSGDDRWVSVVTSANLARGAQRAQFNDAVVLRGRRDLHDRLARIFERQARDRAVGRPFRHYRLADAALIFGPWNSPRQTDPVLRRIAALPARGTTIRVAMSNWQDPRGVRIARVLARKEERGAEVRVLASRPFDHRVRVTLREAGITVRRGHFGPDRYHHLKVMTAAYDVDGRRHHRVWTGSENWWSPSRGHDEVVLRLDGRAVHDAYSSFLDGIGREEGRQRG
ncbi:phospholipase D-like domain-containing protein [Nocardioides sp. SYSU DS0663]|uniref:phospholipase D-like domain-containing protein n=1 Tax=Nocardioides sp. SYSU DS0663 TaxID=3416445 RepID=UPI003F4B1B10